MQGRWWISLLRESVVSRWLHSILSSNKLWMNDWLNEWKPVRLLLCLCICLCRSVCFACHFHRKSPSLAWLDMICFGCRLQWKHLINTGCGRRLLISQRSAWQKVAHGLRLERKRSLRTSFDFYGSDRGVRFQFLVEGDDLMSRRTNSFKSSKQHNTI